ncbi:MAG TPA: ribose-phosphate diphosphokinase [Treponemataceae bacterium]|jgi:ribose-phosphate pyrophosphokinase|nr:ribose-phosphate diphosphokinase [Treponemataceae bacterium]HOU39081.1 ribose-phosphate diphosphokinase [Treponemataceae bacterium]HQF74472.1 ribose-phosphate diphosphokinase [Treponemataceae bacterium]HRR01831.1 ribose-phosphate diphosphokinase [Treponemataceae bacterium]
MTYSEPTQLAIVACPGGECFANETIKHLNHIYSRRFRQKSDVLAKRYGVDRLSLVKDVNFYNDLQTSDICIRGDVTKFRAPVFKVNTRFTWFMNGEFKTEILDCIRGKDVFIFQDVENHQLLDLNEGKNQQSLSVNDHLMSLLVTIDAVRHAGASRMTLVLPVYPYSRQHKKKGREGLTASLLGHLYESLGVSQIVTLDIHSREIENAFYSSRVENLHASYQIIRELAKIVDLSSEKDDFVVVSPDTGAVDRNKFYATGLQKPLAMLYKERDYSVVSQNAQKSNIMSIKLLGDVSGKVAFLADDMLGTGGTLLKAMEFLKEQGATKIIAAISLPFFTGNAIEQFDEAYRKGHFYRIIGTNAVYHEELLKKEWYIKTNVSGLFAQVISRIHHNQSLSDLLDNRSIIEKLVKQGSSSSQQ